MDMWHALVFINIISKERNQQSMFCRCLYIISFDCRSVFWKIYSVGWYSAISFAPWSEGVAIELRFSEAGCWKGWCRQHFWSKILRDAAQGRTFGSSLLGDDDDDDDDETWLFIWVFPKIVGTPKSSILIRFSILFTIHFGGFSP